MATFDQKRTLPPDNPWLTERTFRITPKQMKIIFSLITCVLLWSKPSISIANAFAEYADASKAYQKLVAAAALQKQLPRLSDPTAAMVFSTLTDHKRFLQGQNFEVADLPKLSEMCAVTANASAAYSSFGLGIGSAEFDPMKIKLTAIEREIVGRNMFIFRDEIIKLEPFIHRCASKAVSLLQLFASTNELGAEQLRRFAHIQYQTYARFLAIAGMLEDASIDLQSRKTLIDTMAEVAPNYADILTRGHRLSLVVYLTTIRSDLPDEIGISLQGIMDTMSQEHCLGMCKMRGSTPKK